MDRALPILDEALARRIQQANLECTESRFRGIQRVPGNPLNAEIRRLGSTVALTMRHAEQPIPNLVLGLTAGQQDIVDDLLQPLRTAGLEYVIGLVPLLVNRSLLRHLAANGLVQASFMTVQYGLPREDWPAPPPSITVQEYAQDQKGKFAEFVNALDNVPADQCAFWKMVREAEFTEWRGYVAFVDGVPAARAAMAIYDGVAELGFAETLPDFRGRGCQTALLHRRLADAARAGCDLVISGSRPNSASERNQQRAGLRVAFTQVNWIPGEHMLD